MPRFKKVTIKEEVPETEKQVIAEINEEKIKTVESATPRRETVKENNEDIKVTVQSAIDEALGKIARQKNEELEKIKKEFEGKIDKERLALSGQLESIQNKLVDTEAKLEQTKESEQRLADLFKLTGSVLPKVEKEMKFPNVNLVTTTDSDNPLGAAKEFFEMFESAPKVLKQTSKGNTFYGTDHRELDDYARKFRLQLIKDTETYARKNGLLQGSNPKIVKEAATTAANIVGGFLATLSSLMRTTHRPQYVYWQFPTTQIDFTKGIGDTIKIARADYLAGSTTLADYTLSGGGSYSAIQSTVQNLATTTVDAVLEEYGLGKASTTLYPISIPNFVMAQSMIDLLGVLERNLGRSYAEFEDRKIRSLWSPTSRIVYNDKTKVTTTATDVDTNDNGTMQLNFLINLYAYLNVLQVEPFMDGCYGLVVHPVAASQLKIDLETSWSPPDSRSLMDLTYILNNTTIPPEETSRVTGYLGQWGGFHVFTTNAHSTGAAGTEGAQNVTLGSGPGSTLTRTSYAFGDKTVGRGIGTAMEIRQNEVTDYGRKNDYIWRSEETFVALDVDPTGHGVASQQLRVIQVRTVDTAV